MYSRPSSLAYVNITYQKPFFCCNSILFFLKRNKENKILRTNFQLSGCSGSLFLTNIVSVKKLTKFRIHSLFPFIYTFPFHTNQISLKMIRYNTTSSNKITIINIIINKGRYGQEGRMCRLRAIQRSERHDVWSASTLW